MKITFLKRDDVVVSKYELDKLVQEVFSAERGSIKEEREKLETEIKEGWEKFHTEIKESGEEREKEIVNDILSKVMSSYFSAEDEERNQRGGHWRRDSFTDLFIKELIAPIKNKMSDTAKDIEKKVLDDSEDKILERAKQIAGEHVRWKIKEKLNEREFMADVVEKLNGLQVKK